MKKVECIAIIKRHEVARSVVASLNKRRRYLIENCKQQTETTINGHFVAHSEICLVKAWKEWQDLCTDNGELYPYDEVLSEGVGSGAYCQNCMDSFNIKHNELAAAKAEFGKAKRALSSFGKQLLKWY